MWAFNETALRTALFVLYGAMRLCLNNRIMNAIVVENLYKSFGGQPVLQGVSFTAEAGMVTALIGSSGSGKSTLLRCINQLETTDAGIIYIGQVLLKFGPDEKPISHAKVTAIRTRVGMVFQQFNLWSHLTILQNLILAPIYVLKQSKTEAIAQAQQLLEKVGILTKQHDFPAQLSGGQQQRAAIARALMMKPEAMLFDEPTSALDPEMVKEVLQVIQKLAQEGMTMLIASHEMHFVRNVAHQVIFLDEGKIAEQGAAQDLFQHPKTKRLRKFLETIRQ